MDARATDVRPVHATMTGMTTVAMGRRLATILIGAVGAWLTTAPSVAAHGSTPAEPPTLASLLLGWTFEPGPTLGIVVALSGWWWAVRHVNAAHPGNRVPRRRSVAFGLGMAAIALALVSGIETYATTLFSVHMVQHVLLTMVAAPLIALSAPITLLLRVATPGTRQRWILPVLHSRALRILAFPVVAWIAFAAVMWASHFSPLFDASLEDPFIHEIEHALFLGSGLLFWWPVAALDPAPWRMAHPVRAMYTFLQLPQNTFLAVVILGATTVLYPHYATTGRTWGPTPLEDQQLAAGIMWIFGDVVFIVEIIAILYSWMRSDARDAGRQDRRADVERHAIRIREDRLAARIALEREDPQEGSGAAR